MRKGQNPAKSIEYVAQPSGITVVVITYIPFLTGYYTQSLEILKTCLNSLWKNTDLDYDLLVFDNASCQEVRNYLIELQSRKQIQFLLLSDKNIGKTGAWNVIFNAAPGELIAYSDCDVYFFPGWLSALSEVFEDIPEIGMITGIPMWSPEKFSSSTIQWAEENPDASIEHGKLLPWEDYWRHASSLGHPEEKSRQHYQTCLDYRIEYNSRKFYVGAGHFQFVTRKSVLQGILPLSSERPMGQVRQLDIALNNQGFLRLSTSDWWVQHLGNTLPDNGWQENTITSSNSIAAPVNFSQSTSVHRTSRQNIFQIAPVRKVLQWLNGITFEMLYKD